MGDHPPVGGLARFSYRVRSNPTTGEVCSIMLALEAECGERSVRCDRAAAARTTSAPTRLPPSTRGGPVCVRGILIRLVTGASWVDIEAILDHQVSDTTLRARRDEWIAAGVFDRLRVEALAAFDRIIGLDLTEVAIDGSLHKAPYGGEGTGPNPLTGANWAGSGRSRWTVTASRSAGRSDGATATTSHAPGHHPRRDRWPTVCSSTSRPRTSIVATTSRPYAADSPNAGSPTPPSNARHQRPGGKRPQPMRLGLRWIVEATNSWWSNYGQLRRNTDRRNPPPTRRAVPRHHHPHRRQTHHLPRPMERQLTTYPRKS